MEGCEQIAEYEVLQDGSLIQSKRPRVFACGLVHPFYRVTFLCHAHAYEAGHKNLKNLREDKDLAEWAEGLFSSKARNTRG